MSLSLFMQIRPKKLEILMKSEKKSFIKNDKTLYAAICLMLIGITLLSLTGCTRNTEPLSRTGFFFDTVIQITLYDTKDTAILDGCFELAQTYEQLFSPTIEGSDVWNINHSEGVSVNVKEETLDLLSAAVDYAVLTNGVIDPTIRPVSELWHFGSEDEPCVPDESAIKEALTHVSYQNIRIANGDTPDRNHPGRYTVRLDDPKAAIDLGCIAKGYIADKLKEYLLSQGIQSACISLGGNVLVIGEKPDHSPFRIGIQEPFAPDGTSLGTVEIRDTSLVTSGIYERCFYEDGRFYHHVLDTATGYPVDNELAAVTILCPSSTKADALSTSCLCLGLSKGRQFLDSFSDVEYLLVTKNGTQYCSAGFAMQ